VILGSAESKNLHTLFPKNDCTFLADGKDDMTCLRCHPGRSIAVSLSTGATNQIFPFFVSLSDLFIYDNTYPSSANRNLQNDNHYLREIGSLSSRHREWRHRFAIRRRGMLL